MKPIDCNNEADVDKLKRDNWPPTQNFPAILLETNESRVPIVRILDGNGGEIYLTRAQFIRL